MNDLLSQDIKISSLLISEVYTLRSQRQHEYPSSKTGTRLSIFIDADLSSIEVLHSLTEHMLFALLTGQTLLSGNQVIQGSNKAEHCYVQKGVDARGGALLTRALPQSSAARNPRRADR